MADRFDTNSKTNLEIKQLSLSTIVKIIEDNRDSQIRLLSEIYAEEKEKLAWLIELANQKAEDDKIIIGIDYTQSFNQILDENKKQASDKTYRFILN